MDYTSFAPEAIVIAGTLIPSTGIARIVAEVRRQVERIIESDPTIRTGLQRGIINSRALSRYMLENCAVDSTPDAILGILRRYPVEPELDDERQLDLKDCNIWMRGGIGYLVVENSADVMKRVADFASTIRSTRGENFRAIVGSSSVRVIAGQEALVEFKETFRPREVISFSGELAEICLLLPSAAENLGAIATAITAQLNLNRINLVGILVCPPEDIIIVHEADATRTFEALQQLLREEARSQSRKASTTKNGLPRLERLLAISGLDDSMMNPTWIS